MKGSDATFKLLVSPTPIVGPDRDDKFDNHANHSFATEGREVRQFLADLPNTFVLCGDRHWQYVSVDPATGLREYSCGPSSDAHSGGWDQNDRRSEHRFLRVAGGFLSVEVTPDEAPSITFRLHDVHGDVVYSETRPTAG
jgi:alkaline phosphatase D